ncbi:hypothetical protein [Promineifilum sp.]|uniref:hypothetical protein n=1 Tax=Promineifilum sp. TaxID=2664178 RepID=UPI0035AE0774
MLHPDVQAEIILSFQEEKRRQFVQMRERERAAAALRPPFRARLLRLSGDALIAAGHGLQRLAGPQAAEFEHKRLGEVS